MEKQDEIKRSCPELIVLLAQELFRKALKASEDTNFDRLPWYKSFTRRIPSPIFVVVLQMQDCVTGTQNCKGDPLFQWYVELKKVEQADLNYQPPAHLLTGIITTAKALIIRFTISADKKSIAIEYQDIFDRLKTVVLDYPTDSVAPEEIERIANVLISK
jgi:hypothetical protein